MFVRLLVSHMHVYVHVYSRVIYSLCDTVMDTILHWGVGWLHVLVHVCELYIHQGSSSRAEDTNAITALSIKYQGATCLA